jgi:hypothetical protein
MYDPILEGQGGYDPATAGQIIGEDRLGGLQLTDTQAAAAGYSPTEQTQVRGAPEAEQAHFNPQLQWGIQKGHDEIRRHELEQMGEGLTSAIDVGDLAASGGFYDALDANLSGAETGYEGAIDEGALGLSEGFADDYRMTPEEQNAIKVSAAMDVGNRNRAVMDEISRRAAASGSGWRGMPALYERFGREAAGQGADAMTRARVLADREAAGRLKDIEGMRQSGAKDIAGFKFGATSNLADLGHQTATDAEQARLSGARDIATRRETAALASGQAGLGLEGSIAGEHQGLATDLRNFGTGQARYLDTTRSQRAQDIAQNRIDASKWASAENFNRKRYSDQALTNRVTGVADAKRSDEQEARRWGTGQQETEQEGRLETGRQQIAGVGTTSGIQLGAVNARKVSKGGKKFNIAGWGGAEWGGGQGFEP